MKPLSGGARKRISPFISVMLLSIDRYSGMVYKNTDWSVFFLTGRLPYAATK
jgi:hypothetical protein